MGALYATTTMTTDYPVVAMDTNNIMLGLFPWLPLTKPLQFVSMDTNGRMRGLWPWIQTAAN